MADLQTTGNQLSVFEIDETVPTDRIVAALAAGGEHVSVFDYVLFDEGVLSHLGIQFAFQLGMTPDAGVNHNHRDLIQLTATGLLGLAFVLSNDGKFKRYTDRDVANIVATSIRAGHFDITALNENFVSSLKARCDRYSIPFPL